MNTIFCYLSLFCSSETSWWSLQLTIQIIPLLWVRTLSPRTQANIHNSLRQIYIFIWLNYFYPGFEFAAWLVSFHLPIPSFCMERNKKELLLFILFSLMIFRDLPYSSHFQPNLPLPSSRAGVLSYFAVLCIDAIPRLWLPLSPLSFLYSFMSVKAAKVDHTYRY